MDLETTVLLAGLVFPEFRSWYEGKLCFSDLFARQVKMVYLDGHTTLGVEVPGMPSGLGWLVYGRLLRLDPTGLVEATDLSNLTATLVNDMVVDQSGRAYFGFVFKSGREKSFPTSDFMKWIVIMMRTGVIMPKLRAFRHNLHPSEMKMLAKFILRGISKIGIAYPGKLA